MNKIVVLSGINIKFTAENFEVLGKPLMNLIGIICIWKRRIWLIINSSAIVYFVERCLASYPHVSIKRTNEEIQEESPNYSS